MTSTSVGMRCPECARQKTEVRTLASASGEPTATYVLVALNVIAFIASTFTGGGLASRGGGEVILNGALNGAAIADSHEYWRLITGGFLHAGLLHIAFNMWILWVLGTELEPAIGRARFLALYFTSLLAGAFGALLLTDPNVNTVGASGAVFGLMGGAFVSMRARGFDPMQSGLGVMIGLNLLLTFAIPGISVGGHIGGLLGGAAAAWLLVDFGERQRSLTLPLLACVVLGVLAVAGSLAVAGG